MTYPNNWQTGIWHTLLRIEVVFNLSTVWIIMKLWYLKFHKMLIKLKHLRGTWTGFSDFVKMNTLE